MDTEKTLTSLLGALEGDRLGLVVGCKVIRRRRTYHVSTCEKICINGILFWYLSNIHRDKIFNLLLISSYLPLSTAICLVIPKVIRSGFCLGSRSLDLMLAVKINELCCKYNVM